VDNPYLISKYQSQDNAIKLINALYCMVNSNLDVVILTPPALNLRLGKAKDFKSSIIELRVDNTIDIQQFAKKLIELGYKREENVQQVGEFAIRGEVIDIFAPNHQYPIRINLFDDLIENIIYFDNINLATISKLEHLQICPIKDLILSNELKNPGIYQVVMDARRGNSFAKVVKVNEQDIEVLLDETFIENEVLTNQYGEYKVINVEDTKYQVDLLLKYNLIKEEKDVHAFVPTYLRSGV
jgi:transcription-repair coupling factor (superfamily II helicase)